jgi:hypothetical protein
MEGTLPTELGLLSNKLTILELNWTKRRGTLPKEYSKLTNLIEMDLAYNLITGTIPSEYARLTNLSKYLIFAFVGCETSFLLAYCILT